MKKKYIAFASSATIFAIGCISLATLKGNSLLETHFLNVRATECSQCSGNHYALNDWAWKFKDIIVNKDPKGKGYNGTYEYWHCCTCHKYYLNKSDIPGYDASKWEDKDTPSESSLDKTNLDDPRIQFGGTSNIFLVKNLQGGAITVDGARDSLYDNAVKYNFAAPQWSDATHPSETTATIEALWQNNMLYIFVTVNDATKCTRDFETAGTETWTEYNDAVELRIDTLHSEKYASDDWDGTTNNGKYRNSSGDTTKYPWGIACEGRIKIAAGYNGSQQCGDGIGCEFVYGWFLSDMARSDNATYAKSQYISDTQYGVEFAIKLDNQYSYINPNNEIGMAIKIYDKYEYNKASGVINLEQLGDNYDYLRCFSNFKLVGYNNAN